MTAPVCFTAAVIGLGRIGQGYDYDERGTGRIVTHASAFHRHDGYTLVAAVDNDPRERARFERKFERPAYANVMELHARCRPDVVSIAVPTAHHVQVAERVLEARPRAVICEKPIALRRAGAEHIVRLAHDAGTALAVNYIRRFEPGVRALQRMLHEGELGEIVKGTVWYTKGLQHNGSHFVDLLRFLLGDVTGIRVIDPGRDLYGDAELDLCLRFGKATVYVLAARDECYSMGDVMLVGTLGTVRYGDGGAVIEVRRAHTVGDERRLARDPDVLPTDLTRYQWHVVDALYQHLTAHAPLVSDGRSATETLAVIETALEDRQRW